MAQFIFLKDFSIGGKEPFSFKKGDTVNGTYNKGGFAERDGSVSSPSASIFIPNREGSFAIGLDTVQLYTESVVNPKSTPKGTNSIVTKNFFTPAKIVIGLVIIVAIVGVLKWQKII